MFEDNNINDFDLMMKSILDEAQEEVPEGIWEGISDGLDKAARRRKVILWCKRAAVVTAAAAALVIGIMPNHEDNLKSQNGTTELIAVVEPEAGMSEQFMNEDADISVEEMTSVKTADEAKVFQLIAHADIPEEQTQYKENTEESIPHDASEAIRTAEQPKIAVDNVQVPEKEYFPEDWGEEEKSEKRDISLVLSGIAGTNSAKNNSRIGPMKSPSAGVPQKTGITETSSKSTYGIPLSVGAGVKIGLDKRWSIGVGLNYTYLSRKFYGKYTQIGENGQISNTVSSDIHNSQHYIGIPINAFCSILNNDHINFYAYAGGTVEKCISDKYDVLNTPFIHKESVKGVQLSANAGIGVEFLLGKHLGLYIDPSLRYYFNNGQPKSIRTAQPLMLGFEMGFRARL